MKSKIHDHVLQRIWCPPMEYGMTEIVRDYEHCLQVMELTTVEIIC